MDHLTDNGEGCTGLSHGDKCISERLSVWLLISHSQLYSLSSFCCAVSRSAQVVVRPAQRQTLVRRGLTWTHMIFIMRQSKQNKPPQLSHYAACSGALCVIALDQSYVRELRSAQPAALPLEKSTSCFSSGSVLGIIRREEKTSATLQTTASETRTSNLISLDRSSSHFYLQRSSDGEPPCVFWLS